MLLYIQEVWREMFPDFLKQLNNCIKWQTLQPPASVIGSMPSCLHNGLPCSRHHRSIWQYLDAQNDYFSHMSFFFNRGNSSLGFLFSTGQKWISYQFPSCKGFSLQSSTCLFQCKGQCTLTLPCWYVSSQTFLSCGVLIYFV